MWQCSSEGRHRWYLDLWEENLGMLMNMIWSPYNWIYRRIKMLVFNITIIIAPYHFLLCCISLFSTQGHPLLCLVLQFHWYAMLCACGWISATALVMGAYVPIYKLISFTFHSQGHPHSTKRTTFSSPFLSQATLKLCVSQLINTLFLVCV